MRCYVHYELQEIRDFGLFCSLVYPKCLAWYLTHRGTSNYLINVYI